MAQFGNKGKDYTSHRTYQLGHHRFTLAFFGLGFKECGRSFFQNAGIQCHNLRIYACVFDKACVLHLHRRFRFQNGPGLSHHCLFGYTFLAGLQFSVCNKHVVYIARCAGLQTDDCEQYDDSECFHGLYSIVKNPGWIVWNYV